MPGTRLRVMSFNIHGGRPPIGAVNLDAVAGVIRDVSPDLAGLQEVHRFMPPPYVFQDQPAMLREALGMQVSFRRSFGLGPIGYGNAILSKHPLDLFRRIRLPGLAKWQAIEPRAMLEGRYTVGGRNIRLLNTHLGLSHEQRCRQVRRLAERIRSYSEPVVVMGDFNATPESPEIQMLVDCDLTDCASADVYTFPCDKPKCRLDHILVSRHFEVEDCFAPRTQVSDHLPLVADLILRD